VLVNCTSINNFCFKGDGIFEDEKNSLKESGIEGKSLSQYIVTNCDLVRLRYLLVYAKQPASMRFPTSNSSDRNGKKIRN
jgi:hypothetical protein